MKLKKLLLTSLFILFVGFAGCAQSGDIFPDLASELATPSALFVDVANGRLYVVNSNAKVLYDWHQGSFQVYDITAPLVPALLKSTLTSSFSGQVYVDTALQEAFVPNRFSESDADTEDALFVFDINEASAKFLDFTSQVMGRDAYAISCCYPANRAWVTTSLGELQYFDLTNTTQTGSIDLKTEFDIGGTLSHAEVNHIALLNTQAFLSREYGGVLVVNLDDAGVAGSVAVDYYIRDIPNPRGIAVRGTTLYVVGEGNECNGEWCRFLMVLDVSALTPVTGNTTTQDLDKEDDGLLQTTIEVQESPQEVLLSTDYAFVTNQDSDTVSVIDLATNALLTNITVGEEPFSLALYTTGAGVDQYLYVGNVEANTISIIDIPTLTVVATYP
ncbi:MAG: hypothetical protein ABH871_02855 [Pseudomonadota bacterium]